MAHIESQADGDWNTAATWDTGTVPTASDDVYIKHALTFDDDIAALGVLIFPTGSLVVDESAAVNSQITAAIGQWSMHMVVGDSDTRRIDLDGVRLSNVTPNISCFYYGSPVVTTGNNVTQNEARDIIISDPGYIGTSCTLQDVKPEGCARAYARKVSNNVRYLTVSVMIRASMPYYLGRLYRMASSPYQVLLTTDRSIIKGYIETIAPDASYVGTEYIALKVTVAEGL